MASLGRRVERSGEARNTDADRRCGCEAFHQAIALGPHAPLVLRRRRNDAPEAAVPPYAGDVRSWRRRWRAQRWQRGRGGACAGRSGTLVIVVSRRTGSSGPTQPVGGQCHAACRRCAVSCMRRKGHRHQGRRRHQGQRRQGRPRRQRQRCSRQGRRRPFSKGTRSWNPPSTALARAATSWRLVA